MALRAALCTHLASRGLSEVPEDADLSVVRHVPTKKKMWASRKMKFQRIVHSNDGPGRELETRHSVEQDGEVRSAGRICIAMLEGKRSRAEGHRLEADCTPPDRSHDKKGNPIPTFPQRWKEQAFATLRYASEGQSATNWAIGIWCR
jgi:hypothetical protein